MAREPLYTVAVVGTAFMVYIPVAGFINSFGVFVETFDRSFCQVDDCLDILGLISALALANYRLLCWLCVLLSSRFPAPAIFFVGTVMCVLSMVTTSFIDSVYLLLVTHSLLYGMGSTFMLNAPLLVIEKYFPPKHRYHVLTTSIINLGPAVGVIVMNPLAVYLDQHEAYSWRDTLRIFAGFISFVGILHFLVLLVPHINPQADLYEDLDESESVVSSQSRSSACGFLCPQFSAFTWLIGVFFLSAAMFIPKTLFIQYMSTLDIPEENGALVMSYSGVAEAICTLLVCLIGDLLSFHILTFYMAGSFILFIGNLLLQHATNEMHAAAYCIFHGSVDGLLMTVLFSVASRVTDDAKHKKALWSFTNFFVGAGQVAGLPVAGLLYDKTHSYMATFYLAASCFALSALAFTCTYIYVLRYLVQSPPVNQEGIEIPSTPRDTPGETTPITPTSDKGLLSK